MGGGSRRFIDCFAQPDGAYRRRVARLRVTVTTSLQTAFRGPQLFRWVIHSRRGRCTEVQSTDDSNDPYCEAARQLAIFTPSRL